MFLKSGAKFNSWSEHPTGRRHDGKRDVKRLLRITLRAVSALTVAVTSVAGAVALRGATSAAGLAPSASNLAGGQSPLLASGGFLDQLASGQFLISRNGQYTLNMQSNGDLVLFTQNNSELLWDSAGHGGTLTPGSHLKMQTNGNLVIYSPSNDVQWNSKTYFLNTKATFTLNLQDDGNLVEYAPAGWPFYAVPIWSTGTLASSLYANDNTNNYLSKGQYLSSPNRQYQLIMQPDGNLVLYAEGYVVWSLLNYIPKASLVPGAHATMQTDGNLAVYSPSNAPVWSMGSGGKSAANFYSTIQSDGNLVVFAPTGVAQWATSTHGTSILAGHVLSAGQFLTSSNGQFTLNMQPDGNLVMYSSGEAIWSLLYFIPSTSLAPGSYAKVQTDGNLAVYSASNTPVWAVNNGNKTSGSYYLVLQPDRNVVLNSSSGIPQWWSGTSITNTRPGTCSSAPGPGDSSYKWSARVTQWNPVVVCVLEMLGVPTTTSNINDVDIVIAHESSGNPNPPPPHDSNWYAGTPSEGLVQVIQPTFDAYYFPSLTSNIIEPAANIYAGMNYAIHRYGSIANIPGVLKVNGGRPYVGYYRPWR